MKHSDALENIGFYTLSDYRVQVHHHYGDVNCLLHPGVILNVRIV